MIARTRTARRRRGAPAASGLAARGSGHAHLSRRALAALLALAAALGLAASARAEIRVQDVARLQGQVGHRLMGYGLVVGLNGTGDGAKNPHTADALLNLHRRFQRPAFSVEEFKDYKNVAIVAVEVTLPEFGAREGQTVDVVVSAFSAKSLAGGQLLLTPLQDATLRTPAIIALAGGRVDLTDKEHPTRGVIRNGATLDTDLLFSFVENGTITLVLDDAKAGWQWAHVLVAAINIAAASPAGADDPRAARTVVAENFAYSPDGKNVIVRVPDAEAANPSGFISRVLQAPLFYEPEQRARVVINRNTNQISFTGSVSVSPTVLQLPGLGTVSVGGAGGAGMVGLDTRSAGGTPFQELLATLSRLQLPPDQTVAAVEHLHRTGTLNAQLIYTE